MKISDWHTNTKKHCDDWKFHDFNIAGGYFVIEAAIPAGNYMFKVNNRNTRTKVWNMFKVNNKDTKKTPLAYCIVNFEHISLLCSSVSIV